MNTQGLVLASSLGYIANKPLTWTKRECATETDDGQRLVFLVRLKRRILSVCL